MLNYLYNCSVVFDSIDYSSCLFRAMGPGGVERMRGNVGYHAVWRVIDGRHDEARRGTVLGKQLVEIFCFQGYD